MTGGILQLVSYGIQDEILISKPEISMFITVYRTYTNFSILKSGFVWVSVP